jgi:deoxyribose-phosphate aldolase
MNLAAYIDHTLLKPEASSDQIQKFCQEALSHGFSGVCVNSSWVPMVVGHLKQSLVKTVAVIGFPLGAMNSSSKAFEAEWCVKHGAAEIDMVLHLGALKEKNFDFVRTDISEVVRAAGAAALVKVILETGLLNQEEKKAACELTVEAGAHFVKTCTGFNVGSATVDDIRLMRETVGPKFGVKASGGIKSAAQAQALIEAGANRLGTSSGVLLVQGKSASGGY